MHSRIELIGLAGSGKSTLSRFIRKSAVDQSVSIYDNQRAYYRCFFRANFPGDLGPVGGLFPPCVMRYVVRNSGWGAEMQSRFQTAHPGVHETMERMLYEYTTASSRKQWMKKSYGLAEAQYQAAREHLRPDESILFDEGFVHYASSLFCPPEPKRPLSEDDVRTYLDAVPLPDSCIFTRSPIEVCKRRMDAREKGRPGQYAHLSDDEFDRYLERAERCRRLLKSTLEDSSADVVEFDTDTSLEATAAKARRFVALKTDHA